MIIICMKRPFDFEYAVTDKRVVRMGFRLLELATLHRFFTQLHGGLERIHTQAMLLASNVRAGLADSF